MRLRGMLRGSPKQSFCLSGAKKSITETTKRPPAVPQLDMEFGRPRVSKRCNFGVVCST